MGSVAAASYGLNPLFTLPLYDAGMQADSVLFYRYGFAILMLAALMRFRHISFALRREEVVPLCVMGLLFSFSSLFLFLSYRYMDAGIASTILFMYPVLVAVIMAVFFKEKVSLPTWISIAMAFWGISLLYRGEGGQTLSAVGVLFVLLSSLAYAVYMVGVNRSVLQRMPTARLTFYALLFGISVYVVRLNGCAALQGPAHPWLWLNLVSLALFPTIISLITMTVSIHYIGSTYAAILGALEPITALFFGVLVFGERLTPRMLLGIVLVLAAVTLVVAGKKVVRMLRMVRLHR